MNTDTIPCHTPLTLSPLPSHRPGPVSLSLSISHHKVLTTHFLGATTTWNTTHECTAFVALKCAAVPQNVKRGAQRLIHTYERRGPRAAMASGMIELDRQWRNGWVQRECWF